MDSGESYCSEKCLILSIDEKRIADSLWGSVYLSALTFLVI